MATLYVTADSALVENDAPNETLPAPELPTKENGGEVEVCKKENAGGSATSVAGDTVRDKKRGEKERV